MHSVPPLGVKDSDLRTLVLTLESHNFQPVNLRILAGVDVNLANAVYVKPPSSFSPAYTAEVAKDFNATAQPLLSAHQVT